MPDPQTHSIPDWLTPTLLAPRMYEVERQRLKATFTGMEPASFEERFMLCTPYESLPRELQQKILDYAELAITAIKAII